MMHHYCSSPHHAIPQVHPYYYSVPLGLGRWRWGGKPCPIPRNQLKCHCYCIQKYVDSFLGLCNLILGSEKFCCSSCWFWLFKFIKRQFFQWNTAHKMKFSITDFFSKCDQVRRKLQIWSHLLKKSEMENFIFCAVKRPSRDGLHEN